MPFGSVPDYSVCRWVVERSFGWAARFRHLARRLWPGYYYMAFAMLMLSHLPEVTGIFQSMPQAITSKTPILRLYYYNRNPKKTYQIFTY